jgi:hypothetical protein
LARPAQQELERWVAGQSRKGPVAARALVEPLREQALVEPPERAPAWPPAEPGLALSARGPLA